jgi:alanine racemase
MDPREQHATWVEVELAAIENNLRLVRALTSAQVMAVVKADGYGHGALPVAQAALRGGATWCGVARLEEAQELRSGAVPDLVLGPAASGPPGEAVREPVDHRVRTSRSPPQPRPAGKLHQEARRSSMRHRHEQAGCTARGRHRIGSAVAKTEGPAGGLFTHFARADEADRTTTDQQLKTFNQVVDGLQQAGLRPPLVHAANSAATLSLARSHFDLVRLGIAMYGLHPSAHCRLPEGFRPALSWKAQLSQVKLLPPGRGVSYGHTYVTQGTERIGTIPVGYGDGFRRIPGNQALVRGVRLPVVGRVCMDQSMLQLDGVPEARAGEPVVLIGRQDGEAMPAEELAERWGTINYEVTCGIGRRVPRLYR